MIQDYITTFFQNITLDADRQGHDYKSMLLGSISVFLEDQTKENAYAVYSTFFDVYRLSKSSRSFVDLLDLLRGYEEHTAALNDGQRDHYIHSVNVFILGLCIYSINTRFRTAVSSEYECSAYARHFGSDSEEFLFTWGITALFHDIGYPIEIISNQVKKFIGFVANNENNEIGPFVAYLNFDKLNCIDCAKAAADCVLGEEVFLPDIPTELLAWRIADRLETDPASTKSALNAFLPVMQKNGFVDHGFYSALIILKWYGEFLLNEQQNSLFYSQIVDAAAAIYLHNAYKNVFRKDPFSKGRLDVAQFPLAYLLILCDEAQEWNREAYGIKAKTKLAVDDSYIDISDRAIYFHYVTKKGVMDEMFIEKKQTLFYDLLNIDELFAEGLTVTATTTSDQLITYIKDSAILPRLLAKNIEQLAIKIHQDYNRVQLLRYPDKPLAYPEWTDLPDTLKYSNIRQAQTIIDKLKLIGCYAAEASDDERYQLSDDDVEQLARYEHDLWVEERKKNGWIFGEIKDAEHKISPYLIPYDALTEEIKELDRDTIRNIPDLLESVGLSIFRTTSVL